MTFDRSCTIGICLLLGLVAPAASAQTTQLKLQTETPPARNVKPATANPCAQYGAGFVRVEGSNTCVKLGGSISVGVGARAVR